MQIELQPVFKKVWCDQACREKIQMVLGVKVEPVNPNTSLYSRVKPDIVTTGQTKPFSHGKLSSKVFDTH